MTLDLATVARFTTGLDALVEPGARIGVAVSGGPDSLALLLLAAAARPGLVEAATVDHGLRPESAREASDVAALCERMLVPHTTLQIGWDAPPKSNLQAVARDVRYTRLWEWARKRGLAAVATAHHVDDQAETLLMRMNRGAGVGGLAGVHRVRPLGSAADGETMIQLVRPVLDWRRQELKAVAQQAGLSWVDDPSNRDDRFDRSKARALLEASDWLEPRRLAAVADHCIDAERALEWAAWQEFNRRQQGSGANLAINVVDLPEELRRRVLLAAIELMTNETPPGPQLMQALDALDRGQVTTLAGLKLEGGSTWRLSPAPPRRPVG